MGSCRYNELVEVSTEGTTEGTKVNWAIRMKEKEFEQR